MQDVILKLASSNRVIILISLIAAIVITGALFPLYFAHNNSKDGTEISYLYGLITYTKNDAPESPTQAVTVKADTSDYVLPNQQRTHAPDHSGKYQTRAFPILDNAINITNLIDEVVIGGAQVGLLSIAARDRSGFPLNTTWSGSNKAVRIDTLSKISIIELRYKGNHFAIEVINSDELPNKFSVKQITAPTLQLIASDQL